MLSLFFIIFSLALPFFHEPKDTGSYEKMTQLRSSLPLVNSDVKTVRGDSAWVTFSTYGLPQEIGRKGDRSAIIRNFRIRLLVDTTEYSTDMAKLIESGFDIYRDFFKRRRSKIEFLNDRGNDSMVSLELYSEFITSSNIIAIYPRIIFRSNSFIRRLSFDFSLSPSLKALYSIQGRDTTIGKFAEKDSSAFFQKANTVTVLNDPGANVGLLIAPIPNSFDVREWHADYYHLTRIMRWTVSYIAREGNVQVSFSIDSLDVRSGETIDWHFFLVPYTCGTDSTLSEFGGIFSTYKEAYHSLYYYPLEGYCTDALNVSNGFSHIPKGGFTWWPTLEASYVPMLRKECHLSGARIWQDELIRHYVSTIYKSGDYGLPPYKVLPDYLIQQTKNQQRLYTSFFFAQSIAEDAVTALALFPKMTVRDRRAELSLLERMKRVYDPLDSLSWTLVLQDSLYWFEYCNLWKTAGYTPFIINTHATALKLAATMERLSESFGNKHEIIFWRRTVDRGFQGLIWYMSNPTGWDTTTSMRPQLAYKKGGYALSNYSDFTIKEIKDALDLLPEGSEKMTVLRLLAERNIHVK